MATARAHTPPPGNSFLQLKQEEDLQPSTSVSQKLCMQLAHPPKLQSASQSFMGPLPWPPTTYAFPSKALPGPELRPELLPSVPSSSTWPWLGAPTGTENPHPTPGPPPHCASARLPSSTHILMFSWYCLVSEGWLYNGCRKTEREAGQRRARTVGSWRRLGWPLPCCGAPGPAGRHETGHWDPAHSPSQEQTVTLWAQRWVLWPPPLGPPRLLCRTQGRAGMSTQGQAHTSQVS